MATVRKFLPLILKFFNLQFWSSFLLVLELGLFSPPSFSIPFPSSMRHESHIFDTCHWCNMDIMQITAATISCPGTRHFSAYFANAVLAS